MQQAFPLLVVTDLVCLTTAGWEMLPFNIYQILHSPSHCRGGRKNTHMTQSTNLGIFVKNEFILLFDFIQIYNLKLVSMKINRGRRNQLYLRSRYKKNIKSTLFLFPDILLLFYYERNLRIVSSIYL